MRTYRLINLDAASDRTLNRIAKDAADPREEFCIHASAARRYRLKGWMTDALRAEEAAEHCYKGLPENLRW